MFSPPQLRTWTSAHLRGVGWYLECGPQHVPALEKELFNSLEAVGGVSAEDEALAGLDDKTRDKLIAQDKLKADKVKDALEKTRLKEAERKKKQDDKGKDKTEKGKDKTEKGKDKTEKGKEKTEKGKDKTEKDKDKTDKDKDKTEKGKDKKTNVQDEVTSTILDEVVQPKSASNRGTKRDSSHLSATEERLTKGPEVVDLGDDDEVPVDELIINSSLAHLVPEDGPNPPAFRDVVSFIEKVMHLSPLNVLKMPMSFKFQCSKPPCFM
jgi:hypothetical protein